MQRMVSSFPLPDLVRKVTSDHSGSRLGEVREMIESLLITYGQELDVFGGAVSVFHYDSHQMDKAHLALRVRGSNIQSVVGVALDKSSTSGIAMNRIRNDHEILQLDGHSCSTRRDASVAIVSAGGYQRSKRSNSSNQERGLGDALSRLRSRGRRGASCSNGMTVVNPSDTRIRKTSGLNLMTSNEMAYRRGEISDDATFFEDRAVGQLGEAEHRGRIMSFIYK